jgi:hypothetical protein
MSFLPGNPDLLVACPFAIPCYTETRVLNTWQQRNATMDLNLRGRRALVTGASKGIGLAIARAPRTIARRAV